MKKSITLQVAAAIAALSFCASVSAEDSLPTRAVDAITVLIETQGDAALVQIKHELQDSFLAQLKPYLPRPAAPAANPARKPAGNR